MARIAQPALEAIGAAEAAVTLADLSAKLGCLPSVAVNAIQVLKRRGLVEIMGRGAYRLTPAGREWLVAGRVVASGQGGRKRLSSGLRERAWWLMRELRKFTLTDLLTTLADGTERDAAGNLARYLRGLERAGVVVRMRRRVPGDSPQSNGHVVWWLKRDLGRMPPVWRAAQGAVFDPNSGEVLTPLQRDMEVTP